MQVSISASELLKDGPGCGVHYHPERQSTYGPFTVPAGAALNGPLVCLHVASADQARELIARLHDVAEWFDAGAAAVA